MEKKEIVKQMIDLHKSSFENYFSIMVMLQDQTEKLLKPFIDNVPGECKEIMEKWTSEYKKRRDEFKKAIENGYAKVEAFFDYNAILAFQEQNEKIFNSFLNQTNWMPKDYQKATEELTSMYKKSCDEFKKYVEENINRVGDFSSIPSKPREKAKKQK